MKQRLHKTGSLFMALLLLCSTMSFSMGMHYCGDHLVDFSLFGKANSCGMMSSMATSPGDCTMLEIDMDCCTDVQILVEGQDDFKVSFDQLPTGQQLIITSSVYSFANRLDGLDNKSPGHWEYCPPPLIRNVLVLHQTFLI